MTEIILTSSVLILLLMILRRALRGRISPCVQYALWLLAAARLLIPGTLFTAPVSVLGAADKLHSSLYEAFPDRTDLPGLPGLSVQQAQSAMPSQGDPDAVVTYAPVPPEVTQRTWNWPDIVWKAGMAVTGGALVLSNLAFSLRLRRSRRRLELPSAPWSGKLPVYEAAGLPSPCLSGLFRPAVYLNEAAADMEHPEHILAHEYAHYRHGDHLWAVLRCVCLTVHWYNPLVWWAAALSRRDCELACDAAAIRRLGEASRIDYGQTLLEMIPRRSSPAALLRTATTMTAGKRAMKERIALIVRRPRTRKITLALVAALACLLAACAFGGGSGGEAGADGPSVQEPEGAASPLLEFPGLRWNDSVETVLNTLGVTEGDFIESGEDAAGDTNTFYFIVGETPLFGHTAQYVTCRFIQYVGTGSELGLWNVQVSYPDDMEDFDAVGDALVRQYGPETERANKVREINSGPQNLLGDRYDRWVELQQQSGVNYMRWTAAPEAQTEETRRMLASVEENYQDYAAKYEALPSFEEFSEDFPGASLTWTSNSLWTPTFNTVYFDGSGYVQLLQMFSTPVQARNAGIVVDYVRQGADPGEWLPLMSYMDWGVLARAAVDAGLDEGDGSVALVEIIGTINQYIERQGAAMTMAEYLYILSATAGLDGAPAEGYGYMIYQMYILNPSQFAYVVLEQLPEEQRNEALDFFRREWMFHKEPYQDTAPAREEAVAQLEADLEVGVSASPGEMTLTGAGQTFQFQLVNGSGIYALTYTSSAPGVAEVDENGAVTAVGPGEAVITMHYEGAGGPLDFTCQVHCEWDR